MNNFGTLVRFEFKKILTRKSVYIALAICIFLVIISTLAAALGDEENLQIDKAHHLALSGRELNGELIKEAAEGYATIPSDVYPYTDSEEYQTYARPYSAIFTLVDSTYATRNEAFTFKEFAQLTDEQADNYYDLRINQYRLNLENNDTFSQENVERVIALDSEVQKPFVIQYAGGYYRNLMLSASKAIIIMLFLVFIVSPVFADEYQRGTGSLILTSKNGKKTTIWAKIFVALSVGAFVTALLLALSYISCMLIYGFEGANADIQNYIGLLTYNFTMLDLTILMFFTTLIGALFMTAICLVFSSALKNSAVSISASMALLIISMIINFPFAEKVRYFFPVNMGAFWDVVTQYSFSVLGLDLWLYEAVCIVAFVGTGLSLMLTYCNFNRHQVQ